MVVLFMELMDAKSLPHRFSFLDSLLRLKKEL